MNQNQGSIASAVGGFISALIALLAIIHVIAITQPQNSAVVFAFTAVAGLLLYLAAVLHVYGSETFDVGTFTTILTGAVSGVFGLLTAFNVPDFSPTEQATILGLTATLVGLGVAIWSSLTAKQAKVVNAQVRALMDRTRPVGR